MRIQNNDSPKAISTLTEFEGSNLRAQIDPIMGNYYTIQSYGKGLATIDIRSSEVSYIDNRTYDAARTKHQELIREGLAGFKHARNVVIKQDK